MKAYLGIDWGGTFFKAGVIDERAKLLKKEVVYSPYLKEKESFFKKIKELLQRFSSYSLKGIGVGAPGVVNIPKGFIYYLPNISGWEKYPLKESLQRLTGLPVYVDNDANLFALAELRLGVAKGKARVIFLTLGTGLGGAVAFEGKILKGDTSSGELGHIPITLDGKKCSCGARGCIETFVGATYLIERYRRLKKKKKEIQVREIFKKALQGEREALVVWKEFSQSLGRFLGGMANLFNPQMIVLGGGVAGAFTLFKPLLWEVITHQAMWPHLKQLKIVRGKLRDAGIIGAGILVKENLKQRREG